MSERELILIAVIIVLIVVLILFTSYARMSNDLLDVKDEIINTLRAEIESNRKEIARLKGEQGNDKE